MEDILSNIGRNIRKYRELRGMSRERLAEVLDLDVSYLGQCERGEKQLSLPKTIEAVQYFGIPVNDVIVIPDELSKKEKQLYMKKITKALSDCTDNQLALILKSIELMKPFIKR